MEDLGSKLKRLRQKAGLTQKEVGDLLHISYQAVSKWERNLGLPDPSLFPEVAKILNTTVNDLFYDVAPDNAPVLQSETAQKSAYKPVNGKFLIILISIITVIAIVTVTLSIYFVRQNRFKTEISVACEIFAEENNVSVQANFNGETYLFIRKYFFDGRVLVCFKEEGKTRYYYKDTLYTEDIDGLTATHTEYEAFLSVVPDYLTFSLNREQIKSLKSKKGFDIKLKYLDNLPIARHFGFTTEAKLHLILSGGKIRNVCFTESQNTLTLNYRFGYDFSLELPDYINP